MIRIPGTWKKINPIEHYWQTSAVTNARFAILAGDRLGPVDLVRVADYVQFGDALAGFLSRQLLGEPLRGALLAVAGTVDEDRCVLTNNQ